MAPPLNKVALCCVPVEMNTKHFVYGDKMFCRANGGLEGNTIEKNIHHFPRVEDLQAVGQALQQGEQQAVA